MSPLIVRDSWRPSIKSAQPVVVLGAGINGAAIARELLLNGVPAVVVDRADLCSGATAGASRLIHGGLRYLEYGDFALVRESVEERQRLLQLAPDFVRPLEICIPVRRRFGGWLAAARRFCHGRTSAKPANRGLWLIRCGLWLYDRFARRDQLPKHRVHAVGAAGMPAVDAQEYRWLCSYWDAQILYPERFVVALLRDARQLAEDQDLQFDIFTYHEAKLADEQLTVSSLRNPHSEPVRTLRPAAIINATGAWVDLTLEQIGVPHPPMMGGTKGSHFVTFHEPLRKSIGQRGLYLEADDGRPVFILPFGAGVLVGTTDVVFDRDPGLATATDEELNYLLAAVRLSLPQCQLSRDDIALHYAAVRPLPRADTAAAPGSVTREHRLEEHHDTSVPLFSVVGGKLTTCRSLAEESVATILGRLGLPIQATSRERPLPQDEEFAANEAADLTGPLVDHVVANEWVTTLDDLVERRLMLLYAKEFSVDWLQRLATALVAAGKLSPNDVSAAVAATVERLNSRYGRNLGGRSSR